MIQLNCLCAFLCFASIHFSRLNGLGLALKTLHIGGLFPLSPVRGRDRYSSGEKVKEAAQMAVEDININPVILPGFKLKLYANNTQCMPSLASRVLLDLIHVGPTMHVVLSAGCSVVSRRIAEAAKTWNLNMVSYGSTSAALSDKAKYPLLTRVIPSETASNMAVIAVMKHFSWRKVALIKKNDIEYSTTMDDLQKLLREKRMEILASESFSGDPIAAIKQIKAVDARIIIGYFDESSARKVMCNAYQHHLHGGRYAWFLPGWFEKDWWRARLSEEQINCTQLQMKIAVQGYIGMVNAKFGPNSTSTFSGLSAQMLWQRLQTMGYTGANITDAGYAYDAVWAIALALNSSGQRIHKANIGLKNFTYTDGRMAKTFKSELLNTKFVGVTGEVSFTHEGDRNGYIHVTQLQEGIQRDVMLYSTYDNGSLFYQTNNSFVWAGNRSPLDFSVLVFALQTISTTLYAIICVFNLLCILLAFGFLTFNVIFRNYRYIKMSSPRLNNAIIMGCILIYISVFLFGMDNNTVSPTQYAVLCQARIWVASLGFTLSYGAMFAKTWRVYVIFTNAKLRKRVIHDGKLFLLVSVLLTIDIVILSLWSGIDPMKRKLVNETLVRGEITDTLFQLEYCYCEYKAVWLGLLYAYKGILLLFGVFLAWETRHVTIPALNDAHYIGISVYNVFIMGVIGVPVVMVIQNAQNATYALTATFLIFCTTVTLCLVFIPKIIQFKLNPSGFNSATSVGGTSNDQSSHVADSKHSSDVELKGSKAIALVAENSNIKTLILEKEAEIATLQRQLRKRGYTPEQSQRIRQLFSKASLTDSLNLVGSPTQATAPPRLCEESIHVERTSEPSSGSKEQEDECKRKNTRTKRSWTGDPCRDRFQDRGKALTRKRNSTVTAPSSNCNEQSLEILSERQYGISYQNTVAMTASNGKQVSFKHPETPEGNYLLPDFGKGNTIQQHIKNETTIQQKQDQDERMHNQDVNANKTSEVCLSFTGNCTNDRKSSVVVVSKGDTGKTCFQIHTPLKTQRSFEPTRGNSFHNDEKQI